MSIFNKNKKGDTATRNSTSGIKKTKKFFDMGKTTKLNPVRQTDGVKNHVTHSLSKHKIFNMTAMGFRGTVVLKITCAGSQALSGLEPLSAYSSGS